MERIKKALENARNERDNGRPSSGGRGPHKRGKQEHGEDEIRVSYSETTTVGTEKIYKDGRIVLGDENTSAAKSYKMLRTQVLQRMLANGWNALAITSPAPGDGKTLTAINLAISLAREVNYTVLLVDLDMQNPSIHKYFGYEPTHSLDDYLFKDVPLSNVLFNPGIDRLVVLPSNKQRAGSSEILSSKKVKAFVEEIKHRYPSRFVIFDLPPALYADDAIAFAPLVDAMLLVVAESETKKEEVRDTLDLLKGYPILGSVLNKSAESVSFYGD